MSITAVRALLGKLVLDAAVARFLDNASDVHLRAQLESTLGPLPEDVKRGLGIAREADDAFYAQFPSLKRSGPEAWRQGGNEQTDSLVLKDPAGGEKKMATEKQAATETKFRDVQVENFGERIILPEGMTFKEGRQWLERREIELEQDIAVDETVDAFPLEGAYAFAKAISRKYGFSALVPTPGFFGPNPPAMIGLEIDVDERSQVPWGRVQIPGIAGFLATGLIQKDNRFLFRITGVVKQKNKNDVKALADLTRQIAHEESIYRGKAIRVGFPGPDEEFDPRDCPKFIDTRKTRPEELIFSEEVRQQVDTSLFTVIEKTQMCREEKVPLKRGILLEGPFGTGKTLTAYVAAKKCVENKWTFIYLSNVKDLKTAIHFAKAYEPAVIFAEDVDRAMDSEKTDGRTEKMDDILNTIDGVDTKGMELVVVLTTNHVENIEPAMMRPGRLDAVISVKPPDAKACIDLVRLYARGRLAEGADLTNVGKTLDGHIPAIIREVVERSKLAAIRRLKDGEQLSLAASDLEYAAREMVHHVNLMTPKPADVRSDMEKAADRLGPFIAAASTSNGKSNGKGAERPSSTALPTS